MKLSDFSQGRDNNFNLIRIVAAFAVLMTHSFALSNGRWNDEPLRQGLGMTMGTIAVDVFFLTSGFLVTCSLLNRQSTIKFVQARVLRIFPALLVMLLLTVFVLGPFFSSLQISAYLSSRATYIYLAKCSTLFAGVSFNLPGVFTRNPFKQMVNGSIWTLTFEVYMYSILALVWAALRIAPRSRLTAFKITIVALAVVAGLCLLASHFYFPATQESTILFFMFFAGASFYVLRKHIVLSHRLFWLCVMSLSLTSAVDKHVFFVAYMFVLAYVLFYIAYVPSGFIRKYNHLGDYSYGIYIYAFPVQQSIAALIPGISIPQMMLISAAATLSLAALSWHLLEQRALRFKAQHIGPTSFTVQKESLSS